MTVFWHTENRVTCIPVAFCPSFLPFVRCASLFELSGSVQDENEIHTHVVKTNKEAFTKKNK